MNHKLFEYSYSLRKQKQKQAVLIILHLTIVYILVNLCIDFLIFPVRQISNSMSPDLPENAAVFVTPLDKNPERGDVVLVKPQIEKKLSIWQNVSKRFVAFWTAQQIQLYENKEIPGSKASFRRVFGMPGDPIYMRDYVLYIKPASQRHFLTEFEVIEKTYNVTFIAAPSGWDSELAVKGSFEEMVLGPGQYFVLGDERKSSSDSRLWGPVSTDRIEGKALFCYFPFSSIKIY
ncbi:MAG: signal peptidase I [Treponema sp.]|nr:signal peptidase I [Treponema sp.]